MTAYYPEADETLPALVRRVLPGLSPEVRARVQVVTGGERAGLVVPEHATPVTVTPTVRPPRSEPPAPAPEPDEPQLAARRPRRRTITKETT
ncbi:hypothetical protein EYS09_03830 [Streptomyces kasugaensis]|uniref:Uncharacterized protein n=1 Tax=Streptomyces kasugaensis TaxID=1946 RepID=A0A4Q9I1W4_STRKA|nr:hypothetical protein [Streptomyces kasugaensis]TBO60909.1 hypothetical protein EYS09_03830 [Streptomyces kasugaensis]